MKNELIEFKKNPINFVKEYYENSSELYKERKIINLEEYRRTHYVVGRGYLSDAEVRALRAHGYFIRNNRIVHK
jgi:hypothetical protein